MLCALASRLLCRAENTDCLFPNHIFLKCVSKRNHLFLAKWILGKDERGKNKGRNSISIRHLSTALSHSVKIDFTRDDHWTICPKDIQSSQMASDSYISLRRNKQISPNLFWPSSSRAKGELNLRPSSFGSTTTLSKLKISHRK